MFTRHVSVGSLGTQPPQGLIIWSQQHGSQGPSACDAPRRVLESHPGSACHYKRISATMAVRKDSPIVFSTDHGRMCPTCSKPAAACTCRQQTARGNRAAGDGMVRVGRETKGRKGKGVTVIHGLPLESAALQQLAKQLKQRCGSGGTIKEGVIELQGDHRDMLVEELTKRGYTVRRSGA